MLIEFEARSVDTYIKGRERERERERDLKGIRIGLNGCPCLLDRMGTHAYMAIGTRTMNQQQLCKQHVLKRCTQHSRFERAPVESFRGFPFEESFRGSSKHSPQLLGNSALGAHNKQT